MGWLRGRSVFSEIAPWESLKTRILRLVIFAPNDGTCAQLLSYMNLHDLKVPPHLVVSARQPIFSAYMIILSRYAAWVH